MKSAEKLIIIKNISGDSQEKLADKLGVSFATVNSWINERSQPRKSHREDIDSLYRELTGQKTIPDKALEGKKIFLDKKSKDYEDIVSKILDAPDLYDSFLLKLTYNSNSIEGNTLTEPETAAVIFDNSTIPNKDLIELIEAKNHKAALEYLFSYIKEGESINEKFIIELHDKIMNGIRQDAGKYRTIQVRIAGSNVPTTNYASVPGEMKKLISRIRSWKGDDIIRHCSKIHADFEQIHPFSDGNGRVGRLLLNAMLMQENLPPAGIDKNKKHIYYSVLNSAQSENEFKPLENFIADSVIESFKVIN